MSREVCAPWTTPDKLCNEGGGTTTDCVDGVVPLVYQWSDEELILAASNILYARTCFMYPGVCGPFDVWPCIDSRCYSPKHPCAPCVSYNVILLPSDLPVIAIDQITEDGVVLSPAAYRLDRGNRVVRLDGLRWQRNNFGLPGEGVETIVSYTVGVAPPLELQMAAAALADELKKSCNGQSCALDPRVASFARRGVAVELTDLSEMLKSGATGIPIVDHALKVHGQCAQGTATMVDPAAPYRGQRVT